MKKSFLIVFVFIMITATHSYADDTLVGTTSSNFLKIPPFARAVGMGEAFTAISDGTYGIYYNPAGLTSALGFEIQMTHIQWFQDINYEFFTMVTPMPVFNIGKFGVGFAWFQVDKMANTSALSPQVLSDLNNPIYDQNFWNGLVQNYFSPYDYSAILCYALDLRDDLSAGINLKYTSENINGTSGFAVTGDIGGMYKMNVDSNNFVRVGLTLSNIGSALTMQEQGFEPPAMLSLGVSDSLFSNSLLLAAQAEAQIDNSMLYSLGAEYWFYNIVAVRLGYKLGSINQPTFGAGIKYNNFEFDYAFDSYDQLGNTQRFSLLYSWGAPPVSLKVYPDIFAPLGKGYSNLVTTGFTPEMKFPEKVKSYKINIRDQAGVLVATLNGEKNVKSVQWDGKSNGSVLSDGVYNASLVAEYSSGFSESPPVPVEIDNTPPQVRVDAEPKFLKPGDEKSSLLVPATFTFYAQDRNNIGGWQFTIWNKDKKIFFNTGGYGDPPLSYIWDGKGTNGEYVSTGDIYYYSFSSFDTLGNRSQTPVESQVVLLREVKLTFASDALFDIGMADVKISAYKILKEMTKVTDKYRESDIVVGGYTDNMPPSGIKYKTNQELSKARADAIKFFMVNLLGIDEKRITTVGYGDQQPIASNDTEDGRLKNRRVEITIKSTIYK